MFDGVVVAIEAEGPPPPAYVSAAVQGCMSALGPGRCAEAGSAGEPAPEWRAVIRTSPGADGRRMVIDVRRDGTLYRRRELEFMPHDAVYTRWSTAGVVIAAVVSGELEREAAEAPEATPAPEPQPEPEPDPSPVEPYEAVDAVDDIPSPPLFEKGPSALEWVVFGGSEVYRGPFEYGALFRAKLGVFGDQFLLLGAGGSGVFGNPVIVESEGFVGFGTPLFSAADDFGIDVGASFVGQWLWAQHEASSGQRDSVQTFRFGGGLDLDAHFGVSKHWSAVVGGHFTFLWPEVDIRRLPRQVAIVLPASFGVAVGMRYDFDDGD